MFLSSFIQNLCSKQENIKTGCSFNSDHQCISMYASILLFVKSNLPYFLIASLIPNSICFGRRSKSIEIMCVFKKREEEYRKKTFLLKNF